MRFLGRNAIIKADSIQYNALRDGKVTEYHIEKIDKPHGPEMRALRGPEMSMVFQDPMSSLNPVYKVGDQVAEGLLQHNKGMTKAQAREKVLEMFRKLGIPDPEERIDCYPHQFSGGMKQRVGIARAYTNNPEILLMDEPFGQLDAQTRYAMEEEVLRIWEQEKRTIIFVTNNIEEAVFLADRIVLLSKCPATVKQIYDLKNLPRPRNMTDTEFLKIRSEVSENTDLAL